jgi:excisionase family DNA binding protein
MNIQKELLTVDETGEFLGLKRQTVYNLIKQGKLRAIKLGYKTLRIQRSDLIEYLNNNII